MDNAIKRVLYETHMHTPLCRHAIGEPSDYAAVAWQRGLKGIIVTDHNPMPNGYTAPYRMTDDEVDDYIDRVSSARAEYNGRVDVRLGLESDYFPGVESYLEKLHASRPFTYVLGSVHPQIRDYQVLYLKNDVLEFQRIYFDHLAMAAETGLFDTLAHPDLVKNCHPRRWNVEAVLSDIRKVLDRIAKTGIAMELNTSGLNKDVPEMNPGRVMLLEMHARKIPVVIGADAHRPERTGADFELALRTLREVGYTHSSVFLERGKRTDIPIEQSLASLQPLEVQPARQ
ncbi:MAG TPA: histidinol-phosphatase [Planctomycetota bacterium]|nr:histidinol-phosphatase [Planctomycetota bacterium]